MPNQKAVDAAICGSDMLSSSVTNPQRANAQSTSTSNDCSDCSDRNGFVGSARENAVSAHRRLSDGLQQRLQAVDAFLTDILTGGNLPSFLYRCPTALQAVKTRQKSLSGIRPGVGLWSWLVSTDLYMNGDGEFLVLDHDFSCPSGLERLADLVQRSGAPALVDRWLSNRLQFGWCMLDSERDRLRVAVLSGGAFSPDQNEHKYLANQLGGILVRNRDINVGPDGLSVLHNGHHERIDVLVRRMEDDLLDPNCFRPDSLIGVPGLVRACREQRVCVLNSPGTGVIGNRAVGALIPEMIRTYLNESPILDSATTRICADESDRAMVLQNLDNFAVRTIDPLHPTRPFFGSSASNSEKADLTARLLRNPHLYVARPLIDDWRSTVDGCRPGLNLRVFSGTSASFELLSVAIGRSSQPDGGATLAVASDPTAFLVDLTAN